MIPLQSFIDQIAQAIRALEEKTKDGPSLNFSQAALRGHALNIDPKHCLSCGVSEYKQIRFGKSFQGLMKENTFQKSI